MTHHAIRIGLWAIVGLLVASPSTRADEEAFFRDKIAPILERHCVTCHQPKEKSGGLSLTTVGAALSGGESGATIVPGKPDESLLLEYISGTDAEMPQDAAPLSKEQVASIRTWIERGALWPEGTTLADKRYGAELWWSFRPLKRPATPDVDADRVRTPIDAFVLAKLREQGLTTRPEADRRTLIRRLTFDLHGLPPTPERIDAFLADDRADAYERLVDRLLRSPRYGERWGRHWLDIAHYGDTHGYDKDKRREHAWPYRDYVIRALNDDKPYARFVQEQLAGDVLFLEDPQGIVATGFLVTGPWDFVGHVELREGTVDKKIARVLDRDDMVSNAMSTFVSLTVHCARCHKHQFDPISQREYYRLQAVFAGIDRADRPYDADARTHAQRRRLDDRSQSLATERATLAERIEKLTGPGLKRLDKRIGELRKQSAETFAPKGKTKSPSLGYHSAISKTPDATKWVQVDLGRSMPLDAVYLLPAHVRYGGHPGPGFGFPNRFRVELSDDPDFANAKTVADHTGADHANPGDAPVRVETDGVQARFIRVTATRLWERTDDWVFALAELVAVSEGVNVASKATVTAFDSTEAGASWAKSNLVDDHTSRLPLKSLAEGDASPTNGYHSAIMPKPDATKWVQVDLGASVPIETVRLVPARPTDYPDTPGFGFPVRFRVEVADAADFTDAVTLADHSGADFPNPENAPFEVAGAGRTARYVRVTATRLWERNDDFVFALAELQVDSDDAKKVPVKEVTALDSIEGGRWSKKNLVDGFDSRYRLGDPVEALAILDRAARRHAEAMALAAQRTALVESMVDEPTRAALRRIDQASATVAKELAALPPQPMVYAAASRFEPRANFKPTGAPRPIHLLRRGSVNAPLEIVAPGTVSCIPGLDANFELADANDEGQRRAALACWITHRDNVLTWRSIVNRVWQFHFGAGLVSTPNDFGRMGAEPTHPELLDWLAVEFRDGGGSLKDLHKLIVTSAVYRQATTHDAQAARIDSGNRFLWRMNRRRLDAESVRDATLAVSGKLDLSMGGPGFDLFVFEDDHSPRYLYEQHNVDDPASLRRTVYRFVVRSVPDPFMECLDCADPTLNVPIRTETLTALQALSLLNNPFMVRQAEHFADRLTHSSDDLPTRIQTACLLAYGRPPTPDESVLLTQHANKYGLPNLCRLIFNSNEFLFVD